MTHVSGSLTFIQDYKITSYVRISQYLCGDLIQHSRKQMQIPLSSYCTAILLGALNAIQDGLWCQWPHILFTTFSASQACWSSTPMPILKRRGKKMKNLRSTLCTQQVQSQSGLHEIQSQKTENRVERWGWGDGLVVKRIRCSYRGPEFGFQHACGMAHSHLGLQLQVLVLSPPLSLTHTNHIIKNKTNLQKKKT